MKIAAYCVYLVAWVVFAIGAVVGAWLARYFGEWHTSLLVIYVFLSLSIYTVLFALVYKYVPQERLHWRDVWVGGLVTAILFNIGKFAIGYYLGKSAFSSVYGAAGSLLVFLLWAYFSAQIFLFGAEFTKSYSLVLGTRAGRPAASFHGRRSCRHPPVPTGSGALILGRSTSAW